MSQHQYSELNVFPHMTEASKNPQMQYNCRDAQVSSPTSAESSPPIVSRLKPPRAQVSSPSSVGFSMHRIALALAASSSAKHYILQSKRQSFDRLFVNCIFGQTLCSYSSTLRQKYMKALETDQRLQQRLLNAHEFLSMRIRSVISSALKMFIFKKWLIRSNVPSLHRVMHDFFRAWRKIILISFATQTVVHRKLATSNAAAQNSKSRGSPFRNDAEGLFQRGSLFSYKRIISLIELFDDCFCRWQAYSRDEFSRRNKMLGITSCMERLARVFAYRGCYFKGRVSPVDVPAFLEAGARIDYEKTLLRSSLHLRSAYFIMWAELSPPRQVSVLQHLKKPTLSSIAGVLNLERENIINHASPIIMAGTPPASPIRPSPPESSDVSQADWTSESRNRVGSSLDADLYTAAVLMDHHQSLCDQSSSQVSSNFRRKPKIQYLHNVGSMLPNSKGEISYISDSISETSSNPHSNNIFASTLRPLSPTTKAHIRNNNIVPSLNSQSSAGLLKYGNRSNGALQETQRIQAFKMVRSPPIIPKPRMQEASKDRKPNALHAETQAKRDVAHVGWDCYTGVSSEFPATKDTNLRQHGSFLSGAIAMRMRMSEDLRSKEVTDQKLAAERLRHPGSVDTARQTWVRR
jgi:hypothetical protein